METNFNRFTIQESGEFYCVFKMKPERRQAATGGGYNPVIWFIPATAKPKFVGSYAECMDYIIENGGQYMTDHRLPLVGFVV